jgi:hypothetical protein
MNKSLEGSIPTQMLGSTRSFVVQQGSGALDGLEQDRETYGLLARCIEAVKNSSFVLCRQDGTLLEQHLFSMLEGDGSWKNPLYREAYTCSAVTCALYNAHVGNFLRAQEMLDKAMILGLSRADIPEFCDYVEHFASQAACFHGFAALDDELEPEIAIDVCKVKRKGLSGPIEYPVEERSSSIGADEFRSYYFEKGEAVVIRNMAATWHALSKWRYV